MSVSLLAARVQSCIGCRRRITHQAEVNQGISAAFTAATALVTSLTSLLQAGSNTHTHTHAHTHTHTHACTHSQVHTTTLIDPLSPVASGVHQVQVLICSSGLFTCLVLAVMASLDT